MADKFSPSESQKSLLSEIIETAKYLFTFSQKGKKQVPDGYSYKEIQTGRNCKTSWEVPEDSLEAFDATFCGVWVPDPTIEANGKTKARAGLTCLGVAAAGVAGGAVLDHLSDHHDLFGRAIDAAFGDDPNFLKLSGSSRAVIENNFKDLRNFPCAVASAKSDNEYVYFSDYDIYWNKRDFRLEWHTDRKGTSLEVYNDTSDDWEEADDFTDDNIGYFLDDNGNVYKKIESKHLAFWWNSEKHHWVETDWDGTAETTNDVDNLKISAPKTGISKNVYSLDNVTIEKGASITAPENWTIGPDVFIGPDVVIVVTDPNSTISNSVIGGTKPTSYNLNGNNKDDRKTYINGPFEITGSNIETGCRIGSNGKLVIIEFCRDIGPNTIIKGGVTARYSSFGKNCSVGDETFAFYLTAGDDFRSDENCTIERTSFWEGGYLGPNSEAYDSILYNATIGENTTLRNVNGDDFSAGKNVNASCIDAGDGVKIEKNVSISNTKIGDLTVIKEGVNATDLEIGDDQEVTPANAESYARPKSIYQRLLGFFGLANG